MNGLAAPMDDYCPTGSQTLSASADRSGTIALEDWVDDLETTGDAPEETSLGGGVGPGSIPNVSGSCDGNRLSLGGLDLPVNSRWTGQ